MSTLDQVNKMFPIMILVLLFPLVQFANAVTALPAEVCSTNSMRQTQTVTSAVAINTSPTDPFEDVKLSEVNQTAWESYAFEGVSTTGDSGVSINFYRNPAIAGQGNGILGVQINAVWQNGTQWNSSIWQNQSIIVGCDVGDDVASYGYWSDIDDSVTEFSFTVPRSLTSASLSLSGRGVEGSWQMTSTVPPMTVNASGSANPHGTVQLAPLTYWIEPIPMATTNATIYFSGQELDLQGFGGHWRNWAPYNWDTLASSWYRIRATADSYTIIYWTFTSALDGKVYTSGMLMQNGTNVFTTTNATPKSGSNSASFWLTYSGAVHGTYEDTSTGIVVQFIGNGKEWRFALSHTNVLSESQHGTAQGYTSFVNTVTGGLIDGPESHGVGISDQAAVANTAPI
jgi:hypothetical protein